MELTQLAHAGDIAEMQRQLEAGALPDDADMFGITPLHAAASRNNVEMILLLLAHRANVNLPDEHGGTPLHWAMRNGHEGAALALLSHGAVWDARDKHGKSPMDWAAQGAQQKAAQAVMRHLSLAHARKYKRVRRKRALAA